jgi:sulfite reductase alpha subunit-like flavoprotein
LREKINLCASSVKNKYYLLLLSYNPEHGKDTQLFEAGQHIAIFPKNIPSVKDTVVQSLTDLPFRGLPLSLEEKIALHEPWRQWNPCYSGLTLDELLSNVSDLSRIPDCREVHQWNENDAEGENEIDEVDLGSKLDSAKFIGQIPIIKRRLYSVASCQNESHTVKILLAMHEFKLNGKVNTGLTSDFVENAPLGEKIQGYFSANHSQMFLPEDHSLPILMVSAGSGFAPFLSFVEVREQVARSGRNTGPIFIFHGCRNMEHDFLDQLLKEASNQLNIKTFRAYSRSDQHEDRKTYETEGAKTSLVIKGYVQDLLSMRGDLIAEVSREGGHIYSCGGAAVVDGVEDQLKRSLMEYGCMSLEEMIDHKRYQKEMFG